MGKSVRWWCPQGHLCTKKNATLFVKKTRKEARRAVVNHLHASEQHLMRWAEAEELVDANTSCIASEDDGLDGTDDAGTTVNITHLVVGSDQVVVDRAELEKTKMAMEAILSVCERACVVFMDTTETIEQKLRPRVLNVT